MNLLNPTTGSEIKDTTTISGVLDNLYLPFLRKTKFKDWETLTMRYLTDDEIGEIRRRIVEWCQKNPKASRAQVFEFMRSV